MGRSSPSSPWVPRLVAGVLLLLLLGLPHHRLFIWLSDAPVVKYWKEMAFAGACLAYGVSVIRRRGLTRAELRGVLWATPFVLAVLVRLLVGVFRGEDGHLMLIGGASQLYYVPAFLLTIYLLEQSGGDAHGRVRSALRWVLLATTLAAVLSVLDNVFHISGSFEFFGRTRVEATTDYDATAWRSSATYQSPMVLGMITGVGLLVSLSFLLARLRERPRPRGALAVLGALVLLHFAGLYLTFSRGPLVASAVGVGIIGLFGSDGLTRQSIARRWKAMAVGTAATVLVLVLAVVSLPQARQQHLASILDWSTDENNSTRVRKMSMGLERMGEAPWIGHGLGSAQQRLASYRIQELDVPYFFTNPESQLLSTAMEGGLLLLLPALLLVAFSLDTSLTMASSARNGQLRRLGVLLLGVQGALYSEALIMPILDTGTFRLGFWVLFGTLVHFRGEVVGAGDGEARRRTILVAVANPERTGAPRMVLAYARSLVAAGHRVLAATGPTPEGTTSVLPELEEAGVEVCRVPPFTLRNVGKILIRLTTVIRREGVDCVVGSQQRDRVVASVAAGLTETRSVVFAQNQHAFRGGAWSSRLKEGAYAWALRHQADLVICVSDAVADEVRSRFGVERDRTRVVLNGIDIRSFPTFTDEEARCTRRKLGVSDQEHLVLNVGRIDVQKGQDLLLDAFRKIRGDFPDARLAIVGTAARGAAPGIEAYETGLRTLVEEEGMEDQVLFLGWRDDVPRLLAASDLYVQPSRWEGWPLALVEAMAAGLPTVTSDCSGRPRDFVDGVHGWVVPTGDVPALGQALEQALAIPRPELATMGDRSRELAERHYDIRRRSDDFVALVEGVMA